MTACDITYSGVIFDKLSRTSRPVTVFVYDYTVSAPTQPPGGGPPLHPSHPIVEVPSHPIVLPPEPPVDPPTEPPTNPPNVQWVWGYSPALGGWTPVYIPPEGAAGPKA